MKTTIREYLNEQVKSHDELLDLAKQYDYDTFLNKTDALTSKYDILYRGMSEGDELCDNSFMTDWIGHAREYGEYVDGIIINEKPMEFDNYTFNEFRHNFPNLLDPSLTTKYYLFDYEEYEEKFKEKLRQIYSPYFKESKLGDAMYQLDYDEDKIIDFVYDFITDSREDYTKYSMKKHNDFFIPILTYYAKSKGKNIISFWGGDYGGADEFVVNDISKYTKLSDIWNSVN
jgi:hypothetical protein